MSKTWKRKTTPIFVLLVAVLAAGCDKEFETIELAPDSQRFIYMMPGADDAGDFPDGPGGLPCPSACFYTHGTSCAPPAGEPDSTLVGFSHRYDAGTEPCRCWWYVNCAYRGYVGFDISSLPDDAGLVSAILRWVPTNERSAGSTATNVGNCISRAYRATEPWNTDGPTAGEALNYTLPAIDQPAPSELDVSTLVRGWHTGALPNLGFFFTGPNEDVTGKDNDRCLTSLDRLRLAVTISR